MISKSVFSFFGVFIVSSVLLVQAQEQRVLKIGMIDTLFEDQDEARVRTQIQPFADIVRKQTQRAGDFVMVKGVDAMARGMKEGKLQMGVLHSWEYAWLKAECPDAEPLVVAVTDQVIQKVHVLVPKDSPAKSLDDLKGKTMALPRRSPHVVKFYLERLPKTGNEELFKMREVKDADDAIEDLISGKSQLTMVTSSALKVYRDRKPVRAERVRTVAESPAFPPPALIYRPSQVEQDVLQRFRDAMLKAHESSEGRQTLTLWRISTFQPVPKDYQQMVEAVGKEYPPKKN